MLLAMPPSSDVIVAIGQMLQPLLETLERITWVQRHLFPPLAPRLAEELALPAHAIAYVGDDPLLDVAAARAAGFASVWVSRRAHDWPAELPGADLTVTDLGALADALGA